MLKKLDGLKERVWRRSVLGAGIILLILSIIGMFLPVMPGGGTPASYIGTLTVGTLSVGTTLTADTGGTATYLVAGADASPRMIAQADYTCDGVDDNVQLQAAITASAALADADRSVCIAGTLEIDAMVTYVSGLELYGNGGTLHQEDSKNLNALLGSAAAVDDVYIHDLEIDGNVAMNTTTAGITFSHASAQNRIRIENCYIHDCPSRPVNCDNVIGLQMTNNHVSDNTGGLTATNALGACQDVVIANNTFYSNDEHSVLVNGATCVSVCNNTTYGGVKGAGDAAIDIDASIDATVTGNTIYNYTGTGIWMELTGGNSVVTSNTLDTVGGAGIGVSGYSGGPLIISNNIVDTTGGNNEGIVVHGASAGAIISGNQITGADGYGIRAYDYGGGADAVDIKITGNEVINSDTHGIYCVGVAGLDIHNNTVRTTTDGANSRGINVDSTSTNVNITGNDVSACYMDGIWSDAPKSEIANNQVYNNSAGSAGSYHGIYCSGVDSLLSNNYCYDNQGTRTQTYGIYLESADRSVVLGGQLVGNRSDGLRIRDADDITVQGVTSTDNSVNSGYGGFVVMAISDNCLRNKFIGNSAIDTAGGGGVQAIGIELNAATTRTIDATVLDGNNLSQVTTKYEATVAGSGVVTNNVAHDNTGYIAPGEVREYAVTITAGLEDTTTYWQNPFAQNAWVSEITLQLTTAATATNPTYDIKIDTDGAGVPDGTAFIDAAADTAGTYWSWSNVYGTPASGVQTAWTQLASNASTSDWIGLCIEDAAGADSAGKFFVTIVGQ